MGSLFSKQEEIKVRRRLEAENIRRVFCTALVCAGIIPVFIIINKLSGSISSGVLNGALAGFEFVYLIAAGLSFYAIRSHDGRLSTVINRTFWIVLEISSFIMVYANVHDGAGLTMYAVMLAALTLIPMMTMNEQMYYMVIQAVFVSFLEIKFKGSAAGIFNIVILNGLFFGLSRFIFKVHCENITLKDKMSERTDNEGNDELTGLLNHRGLEKRIFDLTRECIRERRRLSVLMVDMDDLQCYNDTYGTSKADSCIRVVGDIVRQVSLRNTDLICRLYGGKFLICMQGGDEMEPVRLAEKIRSVVEQKRMVHGRRAQNQFVTVSIGAASCIPKSEKDYAETYDEAEESLLDAKEQGKNITVYEEQVYGAFDIRKKIAN